MLKHNNIYIYIYILSLSIILSSCTERIDFELNDGNNNRLVVEGGISSEYTKHKIILSRTTSYFYNEDIVYEYDAEVSITDGDTIIYFSDNNNDGIYETDSLAGKLGKTYTLNIKLLDGEEYSASAYLKPLNTEMDLLAYLYTDTLYEYTNKFYYYIFFSMQEPQGEGDYYMWELFMDGELISDVLREKAFSDDAVFDGKYLEFINIFSINEDKIENDITMVGIKMSSVPKERYDYHFAVLLETDFRGGMFDGPPANIPTNISNNALGLFWAADVNYIEIPVLYRANWFKK